MVEEDGRLAVLVRLAPADGEDAVVHNTDGAVIVKIGIVYQCGDRGRIVPLGQVERGGLVGEVTVAKMHTLVETVDVLAAERVVVDVLHQHLLVVDEEEGAHGVHLHELLLYPHVVATHLVEGVHLQEVESVGQIIEGLRDFHRVARIAVADGVAEGGVARCVDFGAVPAIGAVAELWVLYFHLVAHIEFLRVLHGDSGKKGSPPVGSVRIPIGDVQIVFAFLHLLGLHYVWLWVVPTLVLEGEGGFGHHVAVLAFQVDIDEYVSMVGAEMETQVLVGGILLVLQQVDELVAVEHVIHAFVGEVLVGAGTDGQSLRQVEGVAVAGGDVDCLRGSGDKGDFADVGRVVVGCGVEGEGQRIFAFAHLLRLHAIDLALVVPAVAHDAERGIGHHGAVLALQVEIYGHVVDARVKPDRGEVEVCILWVLQGIDDFVAVHHPLHAIRGEVLVGGGAGNDALRQVEGIVGARRDDDIVGQGYICQAKGHSGE